MCQIMRYFEIFEIHRRLYQVGARPLRTLEALAPNRKKKAIKRQKQ